MRFQIDKEIFQRFPELNIGIVAARGINNHGEAAEVTEMTRSKEAEIKQDMSAEALTENTKIAAWRAAYSAFGAKPKKYKCSVENLYRMILRGIELRHINKLVDIYNYVSIKHVVPVGGDDMEKIEGGIVLKMAKGDEPFRELNSQELRNPHEGEVVYMDDKEVLCRRWNWRECDKTKMTEDTKSAILVVEGLPPVTKEDIESVSAELSELVGKYCGGETETHILNSENAEVEV